MNKICYIGIIIMLKIDLKDRKILYELDLNCRQSNTQIGKKVGLKKDVVGYRIKRMQEEGIIQNYWTLIDTFKIGYNVFRLYFNFQYISTDIKNEIIKYFVNHQNSWAVLSIKTEIDLSVVIWVKDIFEFYQFWEKTLDKYEDYFSKYSISIYTQGIAYKKSFLLPEITEKSDRLYGIINCGGKTVDIDEKDYKLLNELAENARIPLIELAEKIGSSSQTVNYRVKNLVNSGIIKGFRVNLNLSKIDLHHFKVDIYLKDHKLKKPILNYLKEKPFVEYMNQAMGWADIEPEFVVKDMDELIKILDEINSKFSGVIKKHTFWVVDKVHKLRCLPDLSN